MSGHPDDSILTPAARQQIRRAVAAAPPLPRLAQRAIVGIIAPAVHEAADRRRVAASTKKSTPRSRAGKAVS